MPCCHSAEHPVEADTEKPGNSTKPQVNIGSTNKCRDKARRCLKWRESHSPQQIREHDEESSEQRSDRKPLPTLAANQMQSHMRSHQANEGNGSRHGYG